MRHLLGFREVVVADFEFSVQPGERPRPICLVAHELNSGRQHRIFEPELQTLRAPPYPFGRDAVFVAYYASAELGCHLALNWPLPENVLDLYVEFRNKTNGINVPCGSGLLGAMVYHGLDAITVTEKEEMRALALRGGPWAETEKRALLTYCESDVQGLARLLEKMQGGLDLERALLRGRYMKAAARMEHVGVPIETASLNALRQNWATVKRQLIRRVDVHGVYEDTTFKSDRWANLIANAGIPWPHLDSGRLDLSDETFHQMAERFPAVVEPYRQLRFLLSQMRLEELAVGGDGRNRCLLSAFRARTGRNQPSNTRFIFGPAVWLRSLIRPEPGYGLAYLDWCQQEFGIAAYLSGDPAMITAYQSGDPYLAFAKQAGAVPPGATRETHSHVRDLFKACALGVQYAMGAEGLARRIGQSPAQARELLRMHRETYPRFWRWSDAAVDHAMLHGSLFTVFGWTIHVGPDVNPRSLRNFPMQGNGAEMLRLACCFATEHGIRVCAPVHDALFIEAPLAELGAAVEATQGAMAKASASVLDGFQLRSEVKVFRHPERFQDDRGRQMWQTASDILAELSLTSSTPLYSTPQHSQPPGGSQPPDLPEDGRHPTDPCEVGRPTNGDKNPIQETPSWSAGASGEQNSPELTGELAWARTEGR